MRAMNDRAAGAVAVMVFFLSLIVGAFLVIILHEVTGPLFDYMASSPHQGQIATTGRNYMQTAVNYMPIGFLFISFFGIIAYSVFSRGSAAP